jgi:hypothetical protein
MVVIDKTQRPDFMWALPSPVESRGDSIMRCRRGDIVIARRQIEGMDVPLIPAGSRGTVVTTTMFGRPKRVFFAVSDGWGLKRFQVSVRSNEVKWQRREP